MLYIDLKYYRKYCKINNNSNNIINKLTKSYNKQYNNSIKYFDILINSDRAEDVIINNSKKTKAIINLNRKIKESIISPTVHEIRTHLNTIKVGDYINIQNKNKEEKDIYIIKSKTEHKDKYDIGYMEICNNILSMGKSLKDLIQIPCILSNATLYSDGVDIKELTLSNDLRSIIIPYNQYTKSIQYLQRFIFNSNSVFEVTMIDDFTFKKVNEDFGLLQLTLKRTEEKTNLDDMENNIADNSHLKKESPILLQIENKPIQIRLNSTYQLNPKLIQDNKKIIDNTHTQYNFDESIIDISDKGLITTKSIGNTEIIVKYDNQSIKIPIQITNEVINSSKLIIIGKDTARIGKNEDWNIEVYNNQGNKVTDKVKWSLIGEDIDKLLKIKQETNETLKLLMLRKTENIGKKFKIKCESIDGLKQDEKEVTIKSMF